MFCPAQFESLKHPPGNVESVSARLEYLRSSKKKIVTSLALDGRNEKNRIKHVVVIIIMFWNQHDQFSPIRLSEEYKGKIHN